jgi:glycosyltransferase involved in cell wall biosynthesis
VQDSELLRLYKNASVFIYPSLYEGFGLPPLEAMGFGVPVAAALSSSLPEVLGQACLYFNPKDTEETARTINKILKDEFLAESLVEKGFEQVKKYSWENCAKQTQMIYYNSCTKV